MVVVFDAEIKAVLDGLSDGDVIAVLGIEIGDGAAAVLLGMAGS